ncbi:hypothetical protein HB662_02080 [Roseomonas frigidaquae]|uniref:Uncharacterized protein n=1 Tax=Falsiroseomonas frigidaquae TaxID=487318 RepID=A0ABX1ESL4_9PROT|nr:hypothetical protein [Falsiroseomonas frigidaquae]NKE43547.1 hypothetical protein [Falsiroseomonas frigidaquae]
MADDDSAALLQPFNGKAVLDCTGDRSTCAPCTLRSVLALARDEKTNRLVDAMNMAAIDTNPSCADFALFCARMLENLVVHHPNGVAMARAALLLAESKAPMQRMRRHLNG